MFWPHAEAIMNPKLIAEYAFPGSINGFFTHLEYVNLARSGAPHTRQRRLLCTDGVREGC